MRPNSRIPLKKVLLLTLAGGMLLWGFSKKQFTLRLEPASYQPAEQKPIEVHPEVLNLQESFSKVADAVKPAVVNISTVHLEKIQNNPYEFYFMDPEEMFEQFFNIPPGQAPGQRQRPPQRKSFERKVPGMGSGVIIDPDGYILTNEHVVRDANEIKVTLADDPDKPLDGKVVGRDERTDLAVVKIKSNGKLPWAKLGDSDAVKVGDWAIAIGSPFGLEQTVTAGIISAARQNLGIEGRNYRDLIQTDAAINPGNSGGPLLNIRGEVIGINSAIYTPSGGFAGIGFAIPINRAKEIIPQLREKGKVIRSWIGVVLENKIDDATAAVFGVPDKQGAFLKEVLPDYPAAKAGLKRGDIIREFDGRKIKDNNDLQNVVSAIPPEKKVAIKIIRNKKEMTLELTTVEAPSTLAPGKPGDESEPQETSKDKSGQEIWLGATLRDLRPDIRQRLSIDDDVKGAVVVDIEEGSKADEIGLGLGDVVRGVNQEECADLASFRALIKKFRPKNGIVLDVWRRGESIYISYMGSEK